MRQTTTQARDSAYETLRPVLLQSLATLAREGFAVPPQDGMDLIHDFFVEAWESVQANHDPAKGGLKPYVFGAFKRFARPRIVRMRKLAAAGVDPMLLDTMPQPDQEAEPSDEQLYLPELQAAVADIEAGSRKLLAQYFDGDESERALARRVGLTRYRLRQQIAEILLRLAVQITRPPNVSSRDWDVARSIWLEQRSVAATARSLGLSIPQVRQAQRRCLATVLDSLGTPQRRGKRPQELAMDDAKELIRKVFEAPDDPQALKDLRSRRDEVFRLLEDAEGIFDEKTLEAADPERLAHVYAVLADVDGLTEDDRETLDAMAQATADEERKIGEAFRDSLLANLPLQLANFAHLDNGSQVTEEDFEELMATPAAQAAGPESERLARLGLTPLTVFYATDAIGDLIDRTMEDKGFSNLEIKLSRTKDGLGIKNVDFFPDVLDASTLLEAIEFATDVDREQSTQLASWLFEAATHVPYLFYGMKAAPIAKGLELERWDLEVDDVVQRWAIATEAQEVAKPIPAGEKEEETTVPGWLVPFILGTKPARNMVVVSNLSRQANLHSILKKQGFEAARAAIIKDNLGHSLGCGIVELDKQESTEDFAKAFQGKLLEGRLLAVSTDALQIEKVLDSARSGIKATGPMSVKGQTRIKG